MMKKILLFTFAFLAGVAVRADYADDLRASIPNLPASERIQAYGQLYQMSVANEEPAEQQLACIYDLIAETQRQHNVHEEGDARVIRIVHFYNLDQNDSVFVYAPDDLEFLKAHQEWKYYYEVWNHLVNTYVYDGQTNTALDEAEKMYQDAKERDNHLGMGMAYYAMGNVYSAMGNTEEASKSLEQSVAQLQMVSPQPILLADVFSCLGDEYNNQGNYMRLEQLLQPWRTFLETSKDEKGRLVADSYGHLWGYYYLAGAQAELGLGNAEEGKEQLDRTEEYTKEGDEFLYQAWLFYMAKYYMLKGNYLKALSYNTKRMDLMEQADDKTLHILVRKQRADIMKRLGRFEDAAQLYYEMFTINDSINRQDIKKQLTEMNTRFHIDQIKMDQAKKQMQTLVITASIIFLILLGFLGYRLWTAKKLKKVHQELETAHGKLLKAYDQLEETTIAKERIESDLRIARNIQMGMVPHTFPERDDLDLYASMTPAKEVGGDLYDYVLLGDHLYFCLGDVSGKGVPASLFMAMARNLFHVLSQQELPPAEIATRMNSALAEDNENSMFVTMFLGVIDLTTGHLNFCNAGHNPPVLIEHLTLNIEHSASNIEHSASNIEHCPADEAGAANNVQCSMFNVQSKISDAQFLEMLPNPPLGLWPGLDYDGEEIEDISGKALFVYTDGLNEAENRQQEQFTDERLLEILQTTPFESSEKTIELLKARVQEHRDGAEPNDDLTMLCVKVK